MKRNANHCDPNALQKISKGHLGQPITEFTNISLYFNHTLKKEKKKTDEKRMTPKKFKMRKDGVSRFPCHYDFTSI